MEWKVAGIVLLLFAAFAGYCVFQNRERKARLLTRIRYTWGERPDREYTVAEFDAISRYYERKQENGSCVDDITWNDLDMDTIFMLLNHTWSCIGESYLYDMLRRPVQDMEKLQERERLIRYFSEHTKERESMEYFFAKIGKTGAISVFDYIYNLAEVKEDARGIHYLCILLFGLGVAGLAIYPAAGASILVAALAFSWSTYFSRRKKIEPYVTSCKCLLQMLASAKELQKVSIPELAEYQKRLGEATRQFDKFKRNSFFVLAGGEMGKGGGLEESLAMYINLTFHTDLIQFGTMVREMRNHLDAFEALTDTIGILEASIAVASFRAMMEDWCEPELEKTKELYLETEEIYHPMIDEPVKNSIKAERGVLLTGSNASGKSTFLKTIAINGLLAQTIHTVLADSWKGSFCQIYSSMALKDDLLSQESYYMVEIKSLKRILDRREDELPLLCFVDEVLRGTNTVERIAASAQILKSMEKEGVLCFAATHDIELTYLLEEGYDNYHFQEEVKEDDILFNYVLYKGRATSRNAIRLLGIIGYEKEIIQAAERTAEQFLNTGEWHLCQAEERK